MAVEPVNTAVSGPDSDAVDFLRNIQCIRSRITSRLRSHRMTPDIGNGEPCTFKKQQKLHQKQNMPPPLFSSVSMPPGMVRPVYITNRYPSFPSPAVCISSSSCRGITISSLQVLSSHPYYSESKSQSRIPLFYHSGKRQPHSSASSAMKPSIRGLLPVLTCSQTCPVCFGSFHRQSCPRFRPLHHPPYLSGLRRSLHHGLYL